MSTNRTSPSYSPDRLAVAAADAGLPPLALTAARLWLAEQLTAHEYAKLGQGGHTNTQVPLRQVFIDLPVADSQGGVPTHEPRALFLNQLLSAVPLDLRKTFRPRSRSVREKVNIDESIEVTEPQFEVDELSSSKQHRWGATLLIGGPGQGKSTLGQLACQLHRVKLLEPAIAELTTAQAELLRAFSSTTMPQSAKEASRHLPSPRRISLPLQISLPDLAAWLGRQTTTKRESVPILLRFLADLPSAKTCGLNADHLLALASNMPSLLVLDGFDEVGSTFEREQIVVAARELLTTLAQHSASTQVLATTRPQGYADELAQIGIRFEKRYLAPLQIEEALEYARKLVDAKIPGADQRETTLARLHEAAAEPATERLLTTPLQVTILTALVQQLGRAPRERWNLFSRYFAYTYDREIERNTYASVLLAEHRTHIERIHARVALLLQVGAEKDGGASARMPRERLEEVIEAVLDEDEISEGKRNDLVREIAQAAELRLVFLVEPEPGSFGFEIRSLQEFMCAWALTSGRDTEIEARLQQVAKAPMFRNVALFIASRLFSDGSPLRDVLANRICGSLDDDPKDELSRLTKAGALLSLETLEEGAVLSQPKRARALMERATGLLSLPPSIEHVRLARASNIDTSPVLQQAIEKILVNGSDGSAYAAWICILEAANRDERWALETGEKYWQKLSDLKPLLNACDRLNVPLGQWICVQLEDKADSVTPQSFLNLSALPVHPDRPHSWVSWLISIEKRRLGQRRVVRGSFLSPLLSPETKSVGLAPVTPIPGPWQAWALIADFEINPNTERLANALKTIATALTIPQWRSLQWHTAWPLSSCLNATSTPSDLEEFADRLVSGSLGDIGVWRQAEERWGDDVDMASTLENVKSQIPWNVSTLDRAPPFFSVHPWMFLDGVRDAESESHRFELLIKANDAFHAIDSPHIKEMLAQICIYLMGRGLTKIPKAGFDIGELLRATPGMASFLVPRPKLMSVTQWTDLINSFSNQTSNFWYAELAATFDALIKIPGHPFLLRLAVSSMEFYVRHTSLRSPLKETQISKLALALQNNLQLTSPIARADSAILQILVGSLAQQQEVEAFEDICNVAIDKQEIWSAVLGALQISKLPRPRVSTLLVRAYSSMGLSHPLAHKAITQIRDILQKQTSDLDNHTTWNRLALPFPYPKSPLQPRLEGGIPSRPVRLESLELQNVGCIHDLTLAFAPPAENHGQWIVILGPNGVGKTTLLRSLTLAMRSVKNPAIWPKGAFSQSWQRLADATESRVQDSGITVKLGDGVEHRTLIRPSDSISITQLPEQDSPRLFPLFSYGCRRGSALGGAAREVNLSDDDGPEIATLFDEGANLIQAETWLVALEGDSLKSSKSKALYESVVDALKRLLDLVAVEVIAQKVWVTELGRPKLPFSALSDGYLTNAGWFLDLIARWIALADRNSHPIAADFLQHMRGLVLIDEIDLHLHPRWQIEIITRTRNLLPQMSFVVTTHNPLTLVGAKAEEIWVLSNAQGRVKATCGTETPMLLTSGQIYRRYFEIEDIYPTELGRSLKRYSFLSGYALRSDLEQTELENLQKQLGEAQLDPGWDVVERTQFEKTNTATKSSKKTVAKRGRKSE